jgi:hypothetical protein
MLNFEKYTYSIKTDLNAPIYCYTKTSKNIHVYEHAYSDQHTDHHANTHIDIYAYVYQYTHCHKDTYSYSDAISHSITDPY